MLADLFADMVFHIKYRANLTNITILLDGGTFRIYNLCRLTLIIYTDESEHTVI